MTTARPRTNYALSDELAIAYQVHGSGERDLVLLAVGTGSNIEAMWELPEAARLLERLGEFARVIRYDRRGTGLSDPVSGDHADGEHEDGVGHDRLGYQIGCLTSIGSGRLHLRRHDRRERSVLRLQLRR